MYKFKATFSNGEVYNQTENDVSLATPDKSSFFDVLEKEKESPLKTFELKGTKGIFEVNLEDGSFTCNGAKLFFLNDSDEQSISNLRLIYFRRVEKSFAGFTEISNSTIYFLGWQGNLANGENIKKIIKI